MDKINFYFDQMVDETDLDAIQTNAEDADKNLVKDIMGSGIISGLDISPNSPADLTVRYSHGVAYDAYGQRIEVPGDGTKDCSSYVVGVADNERWLTIVAKFARNNYDQRLDGNGNQILYKNDEYFEIAILAGDIALIGSAVKPVPAVGELVMADVRIYYGQTVIDTVDINEARRVVQQNLSAHTGDTSNPHNVTLAQIGAVAQTEFDTHLNDAFESDEVTAKNSVSLGGKKWVTIAEGSVLINSGQTNTSVELRPGTQHNFYMYSVYVESTGVYLLYDRGGSGDNWAHATIVKRFNGNDYLVMNNYAAGNYTFYYKVLVWE